MKKLIIAVVLGGLVGLPVIAQEKGTDQKTEKKKKAGKVKKASKKKAEEPKQQ